MNKSLRFALAISLLLLAGTLSARAQASTRPPRTTDYRFKPLYYLIAPDSMNDVPIVNSDKTRTCTFTVGGTLPRKHVTVTPGFEIGLSADGPFVDQLLEEGEFTVYIRALGDAQYNGKGTVQIEGSGDNRRSESVSFSVSSRVR